MRIIKCWQRQGTSLLHVGFVYQWHSCTFSSAPWCRRARLARSRRCCSGSRSWSRTGCCRCPGRRPRCRRSARWGCCRCSQSHWMARKGQILSLDPLARSMKRPTKVWLTRLEIDRKYPEIGSWWCSSGQHPRLLLWQSEFESSWLLKCSVQKDEINKKEAWVSLYFLVFSTEAFTLAHRSMKKQDY